MKSRSLPLLFAAATALGLCTTGTLRAQELGTASSSASPAPSVSPAPSPEAKSSDKGTNARPPKDRAVNPLILKQYDLNHDGSLDADERKAYENDSLQRRADRLKKYDVNHDGKIDADERIMIRVDRMREMEAIKKADAAPTAAPSVAPSATPAKKDTAKKP